MTMRIPAPTAPLLRPALRTAVLLPVLTLASACASLVKEPQVSLARLELAGIGLTGATARVHLEVHNPNRFSLNASAVEYTLAFHPDEPGDASEVTEEEWRTVATGRSADTVTLSGRETTPVTVTVPFNYSEVGAAAASLLRDGRLRYRFSGAFTVGSPLGDLRIPFDRNGILDP